MAGFADNVIVRLLRRIGGVVQIAGGAKPAMLQSIDSDRKRPTCSHTCRTSAALVGVDDLAVDDAEVTCLSSTGNCGVGPQVIMTELHRCRKKPKSTCRNH